LEELGKAFAEENDKSEEAYNNLMTKSFALYKSGNLLYQDRKRI